MIKIQPFKAVRPSVNKVSQVVSRSYEDYSTDELETELQNNPLSFLHIINPTHNSDEKISKKKRFSVIKNKYLNFKEKGIFITDTKPAFYIYKIETKTSDFCGIIARCEAKAYANNYIKKHENTLERREKLFKKYLKNVGFNAEPVLLTYLDNKTIKEFISSITLNKPDYCFTKDNNTHSLWKIDDFQKIKQLQQEFNTIENLYIADGHHRCASSSLLAEEMKAKNPNHTGNEPYNFFMSYLIPESDLKIYEFNRLVKDLNNYTKTEFLEQLAIHFSVENKGFEIYKPSKKHEFSMYLNSEFYSLSLKTEKYNFTNSLSSLDTQILYKTILKPLLNIKDLRNDDRIIYTYGKDNTIKMKTAIDSDKFAAGFGLVPVTVDELKKIADENLKMPPKSTYIKPKLYSGLTIYEF